MVVIVEGVEELGCVGVGVGEFGVSYLVGDVVVVVMYGVVGG